MQLQVNTRYRDIWQIAYPVIIGSLATTAINITDTIFLGRVGEVELGASALGGVYYFILVMMGAAIGNGAQIMIARRSGENNTGAIGLLFDHGVVVLIALGLLLMGLTYFSAPWLMAKTISHEQTRNAVLEFLNFRLLGIIPVMGGLAFRALYVGTNQSKIFGIYSFIEAALNIYLAYSLIFGSSWCKTMGISGAGLASSIAEIIGLLFFIGYAYLHGDVKKLSLFKFKAFDWNISKNIINLSAPLLVQNTLSMVSWFAFFLVIERINQHELAIANITRSVYMVNLMPIWAFSVAANTMVSNLIGQQRSDEVNLLLKKIMKFGFSFALLMIGMNLLIPTQLISLFTTNEQLISDALPYFTVVNVAMFFFPFAITNIGAVGGTGATKIALIIEIGAIAIYLMYIYIGGFIFHVSPFTLWWAETIYWICMGSGALWYMSSGKWKSIKI
ncbi:MAG: hypothetical protein RIQ89_822 [Bacteroidota bacterium]